MFSGMRNGEGGMEDMKESEFRIGESPYTPYHTNRQIRQDFQDGQDKKSLIINLVNPVILVISDEPESLTCQKSLGLFQNV